MNQLVIAFIGKQLDRRAVGAKLFGQVGFGRRRVAARQQVVFHP